MRVINQGKKRNGLFPVYLHIDAAQAIGKIPVDVQELGADFVTIVGHKVGIINNLLYLLVALSVYLIIILNPLFSLHFSSTGRELVLSMLRIFPVLVCCLCFMEETRKEVIDQG